MTEEKGVFCPVSQGIRETTFIADLTVSLAIERIFSSEELVIKIDNLSSITIHLSREIVDIPGTYYQILKLLAWNKINIIEAISTYTELTIVFRNNDVEKAFSVLKNLSL